MWTTLACGCYANVHGITDFCRLGGDIDKVAYNFDSRLCKAEQLWNVFAEAGKKTLVWHWPGSAWPPSSDNPNLYVVDGTSPGSVGMSVAQIEGEYLLSANVNQPDVTFRRKAASEANAACVITGLELEEDDGKSLLGKIGALKSEEGHTHVISARARLLRQKMRWIWPFRLSRMRTAGRKRRRMRRNLRCSCLAG